MFLALEMVFVTVLIIGVWILIIATRRYTLSSRAITVTFALTALGWMGFLLTTIALLVFVTTQTG